MTDTIEFVYPTQYRTLSGQIVELPVLLARQEEAIAAQIASILEKLPELGDLLENAAVTKKFDWEALQIVLIKFFRVLPDDARKLVATIVGKDPEWVADNLTIRGDYPRIIIPVAKELYYGIDNALSDIVEEFGIDLDVALDADKQA